MKDEVKMNEWKLAECADKQIHVLKANLTEKW